MAGLPSDVNSNILSRIRAKDLARFRCISKLWSETIDDSYLAIMHAKRAAEESTLVMFHQKYPDDDHLPNLPCTVSFPRIIESKEDTTVSKSRPVMEFLCGTYPRLMRTKGECSFMGTEFPPDHLVLGSCNGLLYSYRRHHPDGVTFVVIQPLKKECYELPPIKIWSASSAWYLGGSCGLGFDDSTNTLKMVCVLNREYKFPSTVDMVKGNQWTMVHDLGTDSWREIFEVPSYPIAGEGVFAHGCLHWQGTDCWFLSSSELGTRKVIWFDMRKETFGMIDPPPNNHNNNCRGWFNEKLVDLDGEVGFVYQNLGVSVEVWVLTLQKEWVMHCRFKPLQRYSMDNVVGYWNKDDGDLLVASSDNKRLFVYNLKTRNLHQVNIVGMQDGCETEFLMYRSSLISIKNL